VSAHGPRGGRGASAPGEGAAVASRISASAASEVGWGQWLGQHSEVGDSFEAHQGGEAGWGGGARRRPTREAAEEGGRPVGKVAGVRTVLGKAPVGVGNGWSDPSTWMASATLSAMVCTRRVNGVRAGSRCQRDHSGGGVRLT
jgi:hypothetical protein